MAAELKIREGENRFKRFLLGDGLMVLHAILAIGMVPFMMCWVDGKVVNPDNGELAGPGRPRWRVSFITSLVSTALVIVRLVAASWTGILAWRCAFFLLEAEGLTLGQFNTIVSWKAHWPSNFKRHLISATLLLAMMPSNLVAPVLTGAVD